MEEFLIQSGTIFVPGVGMAEVSPIYTATLFSGYWIQPLNSLGEWVGDPLLMEILR